MSKVDLIVVESPRQELHHVRARGYLESPRRFAAIKRGVDQVNVIQRAPRHFGDQHVLAVHTPALVRFLESSCKAIKPGKYEYPYMIPLRRHAQPPKDWTLAVGYYCIDTFTPIHRNAYPTARLAVDCALTAAEAVKSSASLAYALVRPPGHHAERAHFGGFCYLNSSAVVANYLSGLGRVAMLDVDYHHGNGQQDIFFARDDVLTVSIHGHPRFAYPYFSGYADEIGEGPGTGFNVNLPLPEVQDGQQYRRALKKALAVVRDFNPDFLVVPLGFDPARGDYTGSWTLDAPDFLANGQLIGALGYPTVFVQEGGYRIGTLGKNARAFFAGVLEKWSR